MTAPKLESERLVYLPLDLSFASSNYLNWLQDKEVNKYLQFETSYYNMSRLIDYLKIVEESSILFWAICLKDSLKHIGNIKIDPIDTEKQSGEYGIMMGERSEWGKGYAFESSQTICEYCFEEQVNLNQITLGVFQDNIQAVRLYEKLGFSIFEEQMAYSYFHKTEKATFRMILKRASN